MTTKDTTAGLGKVVQIDDEHIQKHLRDIARGTAEATLNALLDAEPDRLFDA